MRRAWMAVALLPLTGCGWFYTNKEYRTGLSTIMAYDRKHCEERIQETKNIEFNKGALAGRDEMRLFMYRMIAAATPEDVVDFWTQVRAAEGKQTENQDYSDLSKGAQRKLVPIKLQTNGGKKSHGKKK